MSLEGLRDALEMALPNDSRPVVLYSALWPISRLVSLPPMELAKTVVDLVIETVGNRRSLLMPTFAHGYVNGVCDLDREPSTTGLLTEQFRQRTGSRRTCSAFFAFNVIGPDAQAVMNLRPEHAWGDGSLYHWFEESDALFVMLGTHPTHCSYLHRMEWLARDHVRYRKKKTFTGEICLEGKRFSMVETLFVRLLQPEVVNDFTVLEPALLSDGMRQWSVQGVKLAAMSAQHMHDAVLPLLQHDPLLVVKQRERFQFLYEGEHSHG